MLTIDEKHEFDPDSNFIKAIAKAIEKREDQKKEDNSTKDEYRNYTVGEVAYIARNTGQTVRKHIKKNLLKATKVGKTWLISQQDLQNYLHNIKANPNEYK